MFLGVDIGTSAVKVVLTNEGGGVVAQQSAGLPIARPRSDWSEQNPQDWWEAVEGCVARLSAQDRRRVLAIGLTGQMHGAVLLNEDDEVLRPAILWNDGRSVAECAELEAAAPRLRAISGNLAMAGFTAPKLLWVRKHESEIFAATRGVLLPKDYVRLRMTGEKASDVSDAAGTLWLDVARRDWSDELLDACGLTRAHMPKLHEGPEVSGRLRPDVAATWGMERVLVVAGGGDNAAAAAGVGVVDEGDAFISLGTSGVIFVAGRAFRPNPERTVHAFCHCLPGRWHQMSVMLSAASALDWAARLTGTASAGELLSRVEAEGRLDGREIFLPYLSGERTPHNDPRVRGLLFGLDHDSGAPRVGQAVIEGVAFAFADGLDALLEAGAKIDRLTVLGGGARSQWWGKVLAATLKRPLVYRERADVGPALGAARLAQIAVTGQAIEEVCVAPPAVAAIEPDAATIATLADKRETFRRLYAAARPHKGGQHG